MRISDWSSDLCSSDLFKTSEGREGTVLQLRHKYVARMHFVMENYETRFPTVFGIKQIAFDPEKEGGLDQILEELKASREWVEAEQERYLKGPWMITLFAPRVGRAVIEVANGLAAQGLGVKELGRASCGARVCQSVRVQGSDGVFKQKQK